MIRFAYLWDNIGYDDQLLAHYHRDSQKKFMRDLPSLYYSCLAYYGMQAHIRHPFITIEQEDAFSKHQTLYTFHSNTIAVNDQRFEQYYFQSSSSFRIQLLSIYATTSGCEYELSVSLFGAGHESILYLPDWQRATEEKQEEQAHVLYQSWQHCRDRLKVSSVDAEQLLIIAAFYARRGYHLQKEAMHGFA